MKSRVRAGAFTMPIAPLVVVGRLVDGKPNYMPAGFACGVNSVSPLVCISVNRNHRTSAGIWENETFSLGIPSSRHVVAIDYCGLVSGYDRDKSVIFTVFSGNLASPP